MPAQNSATSNIELDQKIDKEQSALLNDFPSVSSQLKHILKRLEFSSSIILEKPAAKKTASSVSKEELTSILSKLQEIIQLPSASFDQETLLYLEQQLTDILGFDISSTLEGVTLPFSKVIIKALPELRISPQTTKDFYLPEAGQSKHRSYFGWETSNLDAATKQPSTASYFWIALPYLNSPSTAMADSQTKSWWKNRKVLLINAAESVAIVAAVKDHFLDTSNKYQLGASPAVIREGFFWSPLNLGKSLVFFIDDPSDQVKLGKYPLYN